jgi:hypothetical protein
MLPLLVLVSSGCVSSTRSSSAPQTNPQNQRSTQPVAPLNISQLPVVIPVPQVFPVPGFGFPLPWPGAGPGTAQLPSKVTIRIHNTLLGPSKSDGRVWDGTGVVDADLHLNLLNLLRGKNPAVEVGKFMWSFAEKYFDRPDAYGKASLSSNGRNLGEVSLIPNTEDTFTPQWKGPPGWQHVPFHQSIRLQGTLQDRDLAFDDDMGVFVINYNDILAALRAGKIHQVKVSDQTHEQILFVGLEVTREN